MSEVTEYCQKCSERIREELSEKRSQKECDLIHEPVTKLINKIESIEKHFVLYGIILVCLFGGASGVAGKLVGTATAHQEQKAMVQLLGELTIQVKSLSEKQSVHKEKSLENNEILRKKYEEK